VNALARRAAVALLGDDPPATAERTGTVVVFADLSGPQRVEFGWEGMNLTALRHAVDDGPRVAHSKLDYLESSCHQALYHTSDDGEFLQCWRAATRMVEVTWHQGESEPSPQWCAWRARMARLRFIMLGLPGDVQVASLSDAAVTAVLPGHRNRLRQARTIWNDLLDRYEDEPELAAWGADKLEHEYGLVAARLAAEARSGGGEMAADVSRFADGHLLPRYDLRRTAALAAAVHPWGAAVAGGCAAAGSVGVAVSLAFAGDARTHLLCAAAFAGLAYAGLVTAAVAATPLVLYPYCLRLAAGSVIGMVATFSTNRLTRVTPAPWQSALLGAGLFGYMVVEARQHNTTALAAVRRAGLTAAVAVCHGLAVVSLALAAAGPVFLASGTGPRWGWLPKGDHRLGQMMLFLAVFTVLAGTLVQVLWSDRTVASPLDRTTWRRP
jgi:hypothetical protein